MISQITRKTMLGESKIEYQSWYCNPYEGCSHGCKYPCYARLIKRQYYEDWIQPKFISNAIELLNAEIPKLLPKLKHRHIMLSSSTDAYQPIEQELKLTRQIVKLFIKHGLWFDILTKNVLVGRDFDLLTKYHSRYGRVGFTIITLNEQSRKAWEPGASPIDSRIYVLKDAHDRGIHTWVSCEPIILGTTDPVKIIEELHEYVDHWVFGKHNYGQDLAHDWQYARIRERIIQACDERGLSFLIKKELADVGKAEILTPTQAQLTRWCP